MVTAGVISVVGIISVVIGGHFGGEDHFDGGDHFGGGTRDRSKEQFKPRGWVRVTVVRTKHTTQ